MSRSILTTNRLRLDKIGPDHKTELFELLSNSKVHRHFPKTLDRDESEALYGRIRAAYDDHGYSFWAVIRSCDDLFLAICGLLSQTIDGQNEIEVGYRLSDQFWGCGYGTEAAKGCMEYGRKTLKVKSIISLIRPGNLPSIRVAEKNGLVFEKETLFHGMRHGVYRIDFR